MNVDGKSVIQSDEQMQAYEFKSAPNYEHTLVWVNEESRCGEERHRCAENEEESERGHAARKARRGVLAGNCHTLTISQDC